MRNSDLHVSLKKTTHELGNVVTPYTRLLFLSICNIYCTASCNHPISKSKKIQNGDIHSCQDCRK